MCDVRRRSGAFSPVWVLAFLAGLAGRHFVGGFYLQPVALADQGHSGSANAGRTAADGDGGDGGTLAEYERPGLASGTSPFDFADSIGHSISA